MQTRPPPSRFSIATVQRVRQALLANEIKPGLKRQRCIAPTASADFVCLMEEVLEVYQRAFDPRRLAGPMFTSVGGASSYQAGCLP